MRFIKYVLFIGCCLFADEGRQEDRFFGMCPVPWFTGPLLAPSAYTVAKGHVNVQPYINLNTDIAHYNAHWHQEKKDNFYTLETRLQMKIGLCSFIDFFFAPEMKYRETQGEQGVHFADLPISLDFQILRPHHLHSFPAIKLALRAIIPSGRYQKLNPHKKFTDSSGDGCWFPGPVLSMSQIWHISGIHYVDVRWYVGYRIGVATSVKGLNVYGGDASTRGTEYPGNRLYVGSSLQYSLSQKWALTCDLLYRHINRDRFSGKTISSMTHPSRDQFSLAPAIEYSWRRHLGMLCGVWFTFAGKNDACFVNGMWSLNAYF